MYTVCPALGRSKQERIHETDYSVSGAKVLLFFELCNTRHLFRELIPTIRFVAGDYDNRPKAYLSS